MPARNAAHSLSSLKGLFDQTSLLVRTPAAPTFSAQHFHFHSHMTLRLDLRSNPRAASQTTQGGLRRSDTIKLSPKKLYRLYREERLTVRKHEIRAHALVG